MPPFKEQVDLVAMGLDARLEAPVKMSMTKTAGCLVAWRDADMERIDAICSPVAAREHVNQNLRRNSALLTWVIKGERTKPRTAISRFVI